MVSLFHHDERNRSGLIWLPRLLVAVWEVKYLMKGWRDSDLLRIAFVVLIESVYIASPGEYMRVPVFFRQGSLNGTSIDVCVILKSLNIYLLAGSFVSISIPSVVSGIFKSFDAKR